MSRPFRSKQMIEARQSGIAMTLRNSNIDMIKTISRLLKRVSDLPKLLLRIKKAVNKSLEWFKLYQTLDAGLQIAELIMIFINKASTTEVLSKFGNEEELDLEVNQDVQFLIDLFKQCDLNACKRVFMVEIALLK
jgi:DNA mismatch repair ATPase MutS